RRRRVHPRREGRLQELLLPDREGGRRAPRRTARVGDRPAVRPRRGGGVVSALLDLLDVRPMNDDDRNFVRSSWLRSNRARCEWAPRSEYFRLHHDVVEGLLERSTTLVAC